MSVASVRETGDLPFKVDKMWVLNLESANVLAFGLLEHSATVVYRLDKVSDKIV